MKAQTILRIISLILLITSIVLSIVWYEWHLTVVLIIWTWGNNIANKMEIDKLLKDISEALK